MNDTEKRTDFRKGHLSIGKLRKGKKEEKKKKQRGKPYHNPEVFS